MIAFRDFTSAHGTDGMDSAIVAANDWLVRTGIRPLNVETIRKHGRGTLDFNPADRGLRVWYEVAVAPVA